MSYTPRDVPQVLEQLPSYLQDEFWNIARAIARDPNYTQEQLLDKNSTVNKRMKGTGVRVWDSTNNRPVWSAGNEPTSPWIDGTGTVVHTPV